MNAPRMILGLMLVAVLTCWPNCATSFAVVGFSPFELASGDPALGLQAEYAHEPAISPDGRYLAFSGVVASKHGVFRKDLVTGQMALVAPGAWTGAPSISGGGRYVSFTSAEAPPGTPATGGCTQVYVRDMDQTGGEAAPLEPGPAGAYKLASARTGSEEPLKYEGSGAPGCPGSGSASANRVAVSADGSKVAFTVIGRSNLTGNEEATETPPGQVVVRDLSSGRTTLVSVRSGSEEAVEGPAALSGSPSVEQAQRAHGGTLELSRDNASTAAISADGSTVAWMGLNVGQQVPVAPSAERFVSKPEPAYQYAEPLWRRIAGPAAGPTRRVLAGDEAGCPPSCPGALDLRWDEQREQAGEQPVGPQYGSYVSAWLHSSLNFDVGAVTPQLSADGEEVAIVSTQPDYGHLPEFGPSQSDREKAPQANAFVVNMAPGLTREQAITRLTEWGSPDFSNTALDGPIDEISISGDGTRVAFATERNVFALAPPALVTAPVSQLEPAQLYEANLQAGTLALVSQGYNGEPANPEEGKGGIATAALSQDGSVLALASGSSNLAYAAVNEGSDVFVTREQDSPPEAGVQSVSPLPPGPAPEAEWSMSATVHSSSHGALLVEVSVPGRGRLAASASAQVPTTVARALRARTGPKRHRTKRSSPVRASSSAKSSRKVTVIATRRVAQAATVTSNEGVLALRLLPSSAYRPLASAKGGLYATISVTFAAPGHRTLTKTLHASFPRSYATRKTSKKPARRQARKSTAASGRERA
jgi:WD40-like Beta Propeller Repeat